MIEKGDRIFYKSEWQDKGDKERTFIAVDDEYSGRVAVVCLCGLRFNPIQIVKTQMIAHCEKVSS